jgi:tetratricopeptide (TPR) repeat protein
VSLSRKEVPLGVVLLQAGLVSANHVEEALRQQGEKFENRRIGEILAAQGHINSQTADFFAERWSTLIQERPTQPIGQYFKQAGLLDDKKIQAILDQQKASKLKFGDQAIAEGLLKQTTVDFFLKQLILGSEAKLAPTQQVQDSFYKIKLKLLNLEDREGDYKTALEKVLFWTGGQSFLTQKLFFLIDEHQNGLVAGKEAEPVDYLVQTKILKNWRDQVTGKHLESIETRLLNNQQSEPCDLLKLYRQIMVTEVEVDNSQEQQELIKIGLVVKQQDRLVVANRIYESVFNSIWLEEKLMEINSQNNYSVAVVPSRSTAIVPVFQTKPKKRFSLKNLLLLLALVALLLVLFDNIIKRIKVRQAFGQANEFLQNKSFAQAIAKYNQLLKIDSNYFQAWTNRGYALAGLQNYNEMRESCSTATIINPTAVYAWNCQGEALHNLQRPAEAVVAFDRAIAIDHSDPIFLINKSESLKAIGKEEASLVTITEAVKVLEQIEASQGKKKINGELAVALTFLGNGYGKKEQYEPAIFNYNRALKYSPNYFPAQIGKAIILNSVKRYSEAQEEFENILQNKELSTVQQSQTWFYLGQTLCQSKQKAKSIMAFKQAIKLKPGYRAAEQAIKNCL